MKIDRLSRLNDRLREELSSALYRVAPGEGVTVKMWASFDGVQYLRVVWFVTVSKMS